MAKLWPRGGSTLARPAPLAWLGWAVDGRFPLHPISLPPAAAAHRHYAELPAPYCRALPAATGTECELSCRYVCTLYACMCVCVLASDMLVHAVCRSDQAMH